MTRRRTNIINSISMRNYLKVVKLSELDRAQQRRRPHAYIIKFRGAVVSENLRGSFNTARRGIRITACRRISYESRVYNYNIRQKVTNWLDFPHRMPGVICDDSVIKHPWGDEVDSMLERNVIERK